LIKGWYTAASGMMMQASRQDVIANNIANASTSGYKKQMSVSCAFPDMLISRLENNSRTFAPSSSRVTPIGRLGTGVCLEDIVTDFGVGTLSKTDLSTDLSLTQTGQYFAVEVGAGERYTRNGAFKIDSDGWLVDTQGNPVLNDDNGYIKINSEFSMESTGTINFNDGSAPVKLKVVEFDNPEQLERIGDSLYSNDSGMAIIIEARSIEVLQGYLEGSNVNAVREMVDLITAVRSYESLQKVVQAEDETAGIAIDKVGSTS